MRRTIIVAVGALLFCAVVMRLEAATIIVTNTNDNGPGSLRQALANANDGDTINFAVTGTIRLTSGELLLTKSVMISGPGAANLAVDGNGSRVLHIGSNEIVTISDVSLIGGGNADFGGAIYNESAMLMLDNCVVTGNFAGNSGGGIYSDSSGGKAVLTILNSIINDNQSLNGGGICSVGGILTIVNSAVTGNVATWSFNAGGVGAGIYNVGTLEIRSSVIGGNSAGYEGGGIQSAAGTVTIIDSTISGNTAGGGTNQIPGRGGGISSIGTLAISNSTFTGNSAVGNDFKGPRVGGAIINYETLIIGNSTFSGNSASAGGGINSGYFGPAVTVINNSTFSGNRAMDGGGISNYSSLEMQNTALDAAASGENIFNDGGTVTSRGYNISSDNGGGYLNGPGDQVNTDPLLGPLRDNGGPTFTHALLRGSPAIDAGDPNFSPPPFNDQRGSPFVRVFNGRIDIGSFEMQPRRPRPTPAPR